MIQKSKILLVVILTSTIYSMASDHHLAENAGEKAAVSPDAASEIVTYNYARITPSAKDFRFKANGQDVYVYETTAGPFAAFSCKGGVNIEIELPQAYNNITVSPAKHGIVPDVTGNIISFQIPGPMLFAVMADQLPVLYVYVNPLENNKPDPKDPKVKYFEAGQVYEIGELKLHDNETLYIEGGAVVRGNVLASSAKNVRIAGYGVLDGSYYRGGHYSEKGHERRKSIVLHKCKHSVVEDIIMINPTAWMIMLNQSEHITVRHVKQLGYVSTSDGVDIVGSKHIRVENSFLRNGDDCIAVKSFNTRSKYDYSIDFSADVEDVVIEGCILIIFRGGSVFEIGHELRTESVKNVRFRDCDVLGAHDYGAVFGIHNTDRATVSDILYEDIRVEHYYNKLIDLRIIKSRYHLDKQRGQIRNVVFRNIDVSVSKFNPGYSISLIGGYNAEHTVEHVLFDDFRLNDEKVSNADQLDLYIKQASDIEFK